MKADKVTLPGLVEKVFDIEENTLLIKSRKKKIVQARQTYTVLLRNMGYSFYPISYLTFQNSSQIIKALEQFYTLIHKDTAIITMLGEICKMMDAAIKNQSLLIPKFSRDKPLRVGSDIEFMPFEPLRIDPLPAKFPVLRSLTDTEFLAESEGVSMEEKKVVFGKVNVRHQMLSAVNKFDLQLSHLPVTMNGRYFVIKLMTDPIQANQNRICFFTYGIWETTLDGFLDQISEDRKGIITVSIQILPIMYA